MKNDKIQNLIFNFDLKFRFDIQIAHDDNLFCIEIKSLFKSINEVNIVQYQHLRIAIKKKQISIREFIRL